MDFNNFSEEIEFSSQAWKSKVSQPNEHIQNIELECQKYVLSNSKPNDLPGAINSIDNFCSKYWMMNIGPVKGEIMKRQIQRISAKKILEIGGYCGYSAMVLAAASAPDAKVYTIQMREQFAKIAGTIHSHAGVKDKISIEIGIVEQCQKFIKETGPFDFILLDHHKDFYLQDLKLLAAYGAIKKGTVIAADNIITPGAPVYLKYFQNEALNQYKSILYHCSLEYQKETKDAVLISEKL